MTRRSSYRATALGLCALGLCGLLGTRLVEARKAVDVATQKKVAAAVGQGRQLAAQGKYSEAIAAFQSALSASPTAASALSELGLAYYHLKRYPEGEAAMRRALKATSEPGQRGRSLYNLGLILEAKGDRPGAIAAYQESLQARTNQVVLDRLRSLDAAAAAALDPISPRSLRGPFPTIKDTCAALNDCKQRAAEEINPGGLEYSCNSQKPLAILAKPSAPFKAVQLIEAVCSERPDDATADADSRIYLLVQSDKGWFAAAVGSTITSEQINTFTEFKVRELRQAAGAAGAPRLLLRLLESGGHDVGEGSDSWENEKLVVAGIGNSGTPSATPPILVRSLETEDPGATEGSDARSTVHVNAKLISKLTADELELTAAAPAKTLAKAHLAPAGKHPLVFP